MPSSRRLEPVAGGEAQRNHRFNANDGRRSRSAGGSILIPSWYFGGIGSSRRFLALLLERHPVFWK
jgi:hypothetical protein